MKLYEAAGMSLEEFKELQKERMGEYKRHTEEYMKAHKNNQQETNTNIEEILGNIEEDIMLLTEAIYEFMYYVKGIISDEISY